MNLVFIEFESNEIFFVGNIFFGKVMQRYVIIIIFLKSIEILH